jgi:predicted methyltransferase
VLNDALPGYHWFFQMAAVGVMSIPVVLASKPNPDATKDIDARLLDVMQRCLEKDPAKRIKIQVSSKLAEWHV